MACRRRPPSALLAILLPIARSAWALSAWWRAIEPFAGRDAARNGYGAAVSCSSGQTVPGPPRPPAVSSVAGVIAAPKSATPI